jgi:uncharacterized membrane protein YcaP (DUF421 family)
MMTLLALYWLWGGFFSEQTLVNQLVFNFALFYPVGFMNAYFKDSRGVLSVFQVAVIFDLATYIPALILAIDIPLSMVGIDFLTMALFLLLGTFIGKKASNRNQSLKNK